MSRRTRASPGQGPPPVSRDTLESAERLLAVLEYRWTLRAEPADREPGGWVFGHGLLIGRDRVLEVIGRSERRLCPSEGLQQRAGSALRQQIPGKLDPIAQTLEPPSQAMPRLGRELVERCGLLTGRTLPAPQDRGERGRCGLSALSDTSGRRGACCPPSCRLSTLGLLLGGDQPDHPEVRHIFR